MVFGVNPLFLGGLQIFLYTFYGIIYDLWFISHRVQCTEYLDEDAITSFYPKDSECELINIVEKDFFCLSIEISSQVISLHLYKALFMKTVFVYLNK